MIHLIRKLSQNDFYPFTDDVKILEQLLEKLKPVWEKRWAAEIAQWEDCEMYWAFRGKGIPRTNPPTQKKLKYSRIKYPNGINQNLATVVLDNGVEKLINQNELEFHRRNGATICSPD